MSHFTKAHYEEERIEGLECFQEPLYNLSFTECIFSHCFFQKGTWGGSKFISCSFLNCLIFCVDLTGVRMQEVRFEESKLVGLEFYKCDPTFFSISGKKAIFQGCNFSGMKMKKSSFPECKLKGCFFSDAQLSESDFSQADLEGSIFHNSDLKKADFRQASHYQIDPLSNKIQKAKFSFPEVVSLLQGFDIKIEP